MKLSELTKQLQDMYKEACAWLQVDYFNTFEVNGKVHIDFGMDDYDSPTGLNLDIPLEHLMAGLEIAKKHHYLDKQWCSRYHKVHDRIRKNKPVTLTNPVNELAEAAVKALEKKMDALIMDAVMKDVKNEPL